MAEIYDFLTKKKIADAKAKDKAKAEAEAEAEAEAPRRDVINLCTMLLKEAKAGELQAIAVACVYGDNATTFREFFTNGGIQQELLAATAVRLGQRLLQDIEEEDTSFYNGDA